MVFTQGGSGWVIVGHLHTMYTHAHTQSFTQYIETDILTLRPQPFGNNNNNYSLFQMKFVAQKVVTEYNLIENYQPPVIV